MQKMSPSHSHSVRCSSKLQWIIKLAYVEQAIHIQRGFHFVPKVLTEAPSIHMNRVDETMFNGTTHIIPGRNVKVERQSVLDSSGP